MKASARPRAGLEAVWVTAEPWGVRGCGDTGSGRRILPNRCQVLGLESAHECLGGQWDGPEAGGGAREPLGAARGVPRPTGWKAVSPPRLLWESPLPSFLSCLRGCLVCHLLWPQPWAKGAVSEDALVTLSPARGCCWVRCSIPSHPGPHAGSPAAPRQVSCRVADAQGLSRGIGGEMPIFLEHAGADAVGVGLGAGLVQAGPGCLLCNPGLVS